MISASKAIRQLLVTRQLATVQGQMDACYTWIRASQSKNPKIMKKCSLQYPTISSLAPEGKITMDLVRHISFLGKHRVQEEIKAKSCNEEDPRVLLAHPAHIFLSATSSS